MFTGDRSGEWLYRALHKAGFSNQPGSISQDDGLALIDCAITAVCHCAPPDNKPTIEEIANCRPWLAETIDLVQPRVIVALGQVAWKSILSESRRRTWHTGRLPKFSHGAAVPLTNRRHLLASYHPSQQNTFTGKLTEPMLDAVFAAARKLLRAS
jgi:uracil-DNA glycosylase family 4